MAPHLPTCAFASFPRNGRRASWNFLGLPRALGSSGWSCSSSVRWSTAGCSPRASRQGLSSVMARCGCCRHQHTGGGRCGVALRPFVSFSRFSSVPPFSAALLRGRCCFARSAIARGKIIRVVGGARARTSPEEEFGQLVSPQRRG